MGTGQGYTVTQIVAFGRASCNYTPSTEEEKDFLHLKVSLSVLALNSFNIAVKSKCKAVAYIQVYISLKFHI